MQLDILVPPSRVQGFEIGSAIDTEHDDLAIDHVLRCRFFSAASTIQGKRSAQL